MNQAEVNLLVSGLRLKVGRPRRVPNIEGPRGGLLKIRDHVTKLISDERLELSENNGVVTRLYAERLISDAILHGDKHEHTFEMAEWWLHNDKGSIHKLFKVLVPRYENKLGPYTKLFNVNSKCKKSMPNYSRLARVVIELKGNPFPPLEYSNSRPNKYHIHNVLLSEAKKAYFAKVKGDEEDSIVS